MPGIAELVDRGADLTALRLLARTDRSALAAILKELGYSKMGHRMELEKALLLDPPAEATGKPPAQAPGKPPAEALGKRRTRLGWHPRLNARGGAGGGAGGVGQRRGRARGINQRSIPPPRGCGKVLSISLLCAVTPHTGTRTLYSDFNVLNDMHTRT